MVTAVGGILCSLAMASFDELVEKAGSDSWHCYFSHKVNVAENEDGKLEKTIPIITLAKVRCDEVDPELRRTTGNLVKTGKWKGFNLSCRADGRTVTKSFENCLAEGKTPVADRGFSWGPAIEPAIDNPKNSIEVDLFGRRCRYATPMPWVLYRNVPGGADAICATNIECDDFSKGPNHFVVACKYSDAKTANGSVHALCPGVKKCVETALNLTPAFTEDELKQYRLSSTVKTDKAVVVSPPPPAAPAPPMQAHEEK